jgi:CHASE3 domain sensor protein
MKTTGIPSVEPKLREFVIMALKDITAEKYGSKIAESPAVDEFLDKELENLMKNTKLKELSERIALKKNTSTHEALKAILDRLGDKASHKAEEMKKGAAASAKR